MKKFILIYLVLIAFLAYPIDRSIRPYSNKAPKIEFGKYEKFTTKNGIDVIIVKNDRLPLLSINLDLKYDLYFDPAKAGLKNVVGELLSTGTKTKNNDELNEEIDYWGLDFRTTANSISISGLSKNAEKMMELFSDVTLNSNFTQEEMDKIIKRFISNLKTEDVNPNAIIRRVSRKVFYGENHPFSEVPTEDTYKNIKLEDCKNYYTNYFIPNNVYITFIGNIDKKTAEQLVNRYLANWKKGNIKKINLPKVPEPKQNQVILVNRDGAVQSNIVVGYPLYINHKNPDAPILDLTNTILGGGVFRLFDNLREKRSYTYGAYSSVNLSNEYVGVWRANADVKAKFTDSSVYQILYEMERINKEPVPKEELQLAKNYLIGDFARSLENPEEVANYILTQIKFNLPANYYNNYITKISNATSNDIMNAAQKYIKYNKTNIIVVGDAKSNKEKLTYFGPVYMYDIYGNKIKETNDDQNINDFTPEQIINNYLKAIGGKDELLNLNSIKSESIAETNTPQGNLKIELKTYRKSPNKMRNEITVMGMKQVIVYNGEYGYVESPMGRMDLPSDELNKFSYEAAINPYLSLEKIGVTVKLEGVETNNNQKLYKLSFTNGQNTWYEFFDVATGLKIKEIKYESSPDGNTSAAITEFSNYKNVGNILFPMTIKTTLMGQVIEFNTNSIELNTELSDELFK
ncbi:MAG TPA: pitrilysin family protein [Ignavibacteriales bacterium]|nr:pitrilysin family protein [Ignavibacteriales bacterium]HOL81031.1 pitrilysin family protein [Ignavibacteriales bacterium]HOM64767.1 pitrilysin family protein [Ignavibacteriales bacterium]HPD68483.1 pitrilysin family protein [Ignavibacteriales bacterium]HPP32811.1 pitrilysin family protein [Ignavibacteriales bacterium]